MDRVDAIIAGVNKAGTTSLFASLSEHADISPSAIKETDHFLPPRWGQPVEPAAVYDAYFPSGAGVRLEASPSYFYGRRAVAKAIAAELPNPQILLLLREPVARAISFFKYQKVRLRIPVELPLQEYLERADALDAAADRDPLNERYFAVAGSTYADYLPDWLDVMGRERIWIAAFETMTTDPSLVLAAAASHLGLGADRFGAPELQSENVTTGFKSRGLQRVALTANDRLERVLRRYPAVKRVGRSLYYRINGRTAEELIPETVIDELRARFVEPNARLAVELTKAGYPLPPWLDPSEQ